ncbi:LOW QUALITY PROTEIN: Hypothetical protein PHPALM_16965 [Phytophthora palmivora]|uniref:Uncharacterized protein n=1 Tax=Phytophthora palmivora TaxID=4796 RepID=A0A2P4XNL1_9STRA|nr:LOW QUALITY PROTEIN: Hypothetical protein PHPALM_16965 [Phytophthora palmivora]
MEYALDTHEWPYLLPALQANLIHNPVQSFAGHTPVELLTALPASFGHYFISLPANDNNNARIVDLSNVGDFVDRIRSSLYDLHQEVVDVKERQRRRDMALHKGNLANFEAGDFVRPEKAKPQVARTLGRPVLNHCSFSALFRNRASSGEKGYEVHASRLNFYADAGLNTTEELLELVSSQGVLLGVESFRPRSSVQ